jgi:hypothetical protein
MATGAAWLNGNRLTERRKRKCALTSTGLLMEGQRVYGILDQSHQYAAVFLVEEGLFLHEQVVVGRFSMLQEKILCVLTL